jgi:hypothetical protein
MIQLSSIIKEFEGRFWNRDQTESLPSHKKALWAMQKCRKESNHHMLARCTGCHKKVFIPHSCGHRSGPIARITKVGSGLKINSANDYRHNIS